MKTKLLFKSLLVAAGLCVGQSAWADDTPYNINSTESAYVDATDDASKAATHNGATLENLIAYNVQVRNWESKGNTCNAKINAGGKIAFYKFPLSSVKSETGTLKSATVKIKINSTGDGKNVSKLGIFGYNGSQDWTGATLTYNTLSNTGADKFGYTVDYGGSFPILDVNSHELGGGANAEVQASALAYVQSALTAGRDYVSFAVSNNSTRVTNLNVSATLSLVYSSAVATTYTIKFQDGSGNTLKDDVVYDTFEGETFTASSSDMATFYNGDFTKIYTYQSGNNTPTAVATASSNIITLVFNEAPNSQYTYSVNAIGDLSKDGIASITLYNGQTSTLYYNKFIQDSGNWYSTATNGNSGSSISYGVSVTGVGSMNKTYSSADITDFIEVEDMHKNHSWANEGTASRASKGKAPRLSNDAYAFTEPIALGGTFDITLGGRGVSNDATVALYVGTKVSDSEVSNMEFKGTFSSWSNAGIAEIRIENVIVKPGQVIVIKNPSDVNNCYVETDYLYYKKTADFFVTTSAIPTSTYGTIASAYALDCANLPDGLEAYKVTDITASAVTLEQVTEAVAPGTGLILKGTASTAYNIPVAATGSDISATNYLKAAVTATTLADGSFYILKSGEFHKVIDTADEDARTIPAGKAYLLASDVTAGAPALNFVFAGSETTGINAVNGSQSMVKGSQVYNLAGQRVAQPTRGLYIVNGKKVVVK